MLDSSIKTSVLDCFSSMVEQVLSTLQSTVQDFSILQDNVTITTDTVIHKIPHTGSGAGCSWDFNYPALISLMNGQYYVEYHAIFDIMGILVMLEAKWNKTIGWLGNDVKELAKMTYEQVCQKIVSCGDKFSWWPI